VDEPFAGVDVGVQRDIDDLDVTVGGPLLELARAKAHEPAFATKGVRDVGRGLAGGEGTGLHAPGVAELDSLSRCRRLRWA
jgi:hypothetical protein